MLRRKPNVDVKFTIARSRENTLRAKIAGGAGNADLIDARLCAKRGGVKTNAL
jgi:hypothetical protein